MKNLALILLSGTALALTACGGSSEIKVPSIGKAYEIFVVAPTDLWKGAVGDSVKAYFAKEVEMINQPEPLFDIFSVPPANYKTTVARHRNILVLETGSKYEKTDMTASYNVNAAPQLEVTITAPSADSLAAFIHSYGTQIEQFFEIAERDRFVAQANGVKDQKIGELIQKKFGFNMSIPKGYKVRNDTTNFLWISYELPLASVGFVIYTYPADTSMTANNMAGNILIERNLAVMQIPGPSKGSFMKTNTEVMPAQKITTVNGRQWNEIRSFWDVQGDFMGGPFVNYTTYDKTRKCMLGIDGYVFSPSPNNHLPIRNYIRQIEAIFMTVKLPN